MVQKAKTLAGKEFTLMNLPFYLIHRIERELDKLMMNKYVYWKLKVCNLNLPQDRQ
jgi:hypothetical protein